VSDELHLVRNRPVKFILQSTDVLHCFYVAAFRQKMDIVPGRYTNAYVIPTKIGKYRLACAEYCGDEHSRMRTLCQVHADEKSRQSETIWIRNPEKPWETGERLYKINCSGCHKINGLAATGPALNTIWGTDERLEGGRTSLVDETYVRRSLLDPNADVVEGFGPTSKMNTFQGKLTEENIMDLIWFLKHMKDPVKYGQVDPKPESGTNGEPSGDAKQPESEQPEPGAADTDANGGQQTEGVDKVEAQTDTAAVKDTDGDR
jgi:cytochrome c oxidase subunit 2